MLERIRNILSADKRRLGRARYGLCRLRHATLHPGAWLWTPGVGGGNLGAGAEAALEEAGVDGELVVGFQPQARMPVHPHGVLARVEAVAPFPDDWEPEGLGASQRYRLLGLQRVDLDVSTTTHKRTPTIEGTTMIAHPDELEPPSPELVELLRALAAIDNHWPPHWIEAFETLPESPVAQWATSLGWRLTSEERLTLFDHPDRIAETIYSTLDSLQAGLDPTRRREAVRQQTHTRRTTAMPELVVEVIADRVGWALFHPADMTAPPAEAERAAAATSEDGGAASAAETEGASGGAELASPLAPAADADPPSSDVDADPEAWLAAQLARGNVIAIDADAPGRHRLRLTSGDLTAVEAGDRRGDETFRLHVRHGRLFLGRGELAQGHHFEDNVVYADPRQWIDVPDGLYRVIVTRVAAKGDSEARDTPAVDYVIQLQREDHLDEVPTPATMPRL